MRALIIAAALAVAPLPALAQETGASDYAGTVPWQFRSDNERIARLATAQSIVANKAGAFDTATGAAGGNGRGGPLGQSTAVNNLLQVTQNISCTASAPGAQITCTGGTVTIDANQDSRGATSTSTTNLTGNTITDNSVNNTTNP